MARRPFVSSLPAILLLAYAASAAGRIDHQPRYGSVTLGPCILVNEDTECSSEKVKFFLYTNTNSDEPETVEALYERTNLSESSFNPAHPSKIIFHGYNSDSDLSTLKNMKNAYLLQGDYNVFTVDYRSLVEAPCYPTATVNIRHVGRCTAHLVTHLAETSGLGNPPSAVPKDLHLIGFSLGAQTAGFVANWLKPLILPRITGLDPALPFFLTSSANRKLDSTDATFVDVLHTNALLQGQLQATGHLDFYLNGGFNQPGCTTTGCSHQRAPVYFAESIYSKVGFWGWPCASWFSYAIGSCGRTTPVQLMGEFADPSGRGVFYVDTDSTPPFALGKKDDDAL